MNKPQIRYSILPSNPEAHLFEVRCTVDDPDPAGQMFSLPTWIPGSYLIREFAKHVVRIRAQSGRKILRMVKLDKNAWQVEPFDGPIMVTMEIYAWDLSVRGAHRADMRRITRDLKTLCETQIRFFREPAPMDRYVFLITAVGDGYGGLEHRASTALLCARN